MLLGSLYLAMRSAAQARIPAALGLAPGLGGQTGLNTLATLGYPPEMRSSGMGWASGVGRFGGILFPLLGGMALKAALPLGTLMLIIAAPALLVSLLIAVLAVGEKRQAATEGSSTAA